MHPIRKTILPLAIIVIASIPTFAQDHNPLINSGEVIKTGLKLHEAKKYKEALREYEKIDRSDTNYVDALYERSYSYYADSQLNKSLELARLGMDLFPAKYSLFSMQAANSFDELMQPKEALKLYDSAIVRNPQSFLLHFNKGIVNYRLENYAEAKLNMQRCLLINPYYSSGHYYLGSIYLKEGNPVAALLAFQTALLISPEGRYFQNIIQAMSSIANVTDEVSRFVKQGKQAKRNAFIDQEEILLSKVALNKQYQLRADLEDIIVRQLQVVNEKLEYNKTENDFAMQFYVPFYSMVFKDKNFEALIFSIFANVNSKNVENWLKNNKKEKQAFVETAVAYFDEIKRTQEINFTARTEKKESFISSNSIYAAKGAYAKDDKITEMGYWEYFYPNGTLRAKGKFSDKGVKEGQWVYYYENGKPKEISGYKNGLVDGLSEGWFDNGNKWFSYTYANGKLNGLETYYYYNGKTKSSSELKDDRKNGTTKYFDIKGMLSSSAAYVNDNLEGMTFGYHSNGKLKSELKYAGNKANGIYKTYFPSGALNQLGEYKNDLQQGIWTTYFEDSIPEEKLFYVDGEVSGEFTEYWRGGELKTKGIYKKKKIDGKVETRDTDGKLYSDLMYENGKLKEVNFYDKAGKIISTTTTRRGAANIVFYSADGVKISEGYYNKDGEKDGKFIYYYASGKVNQESLWKDGELTGLQTSYHPDGKVKQTIYYKQSEIDGYAKEYYANGQLSNEGWKKDGKRQQAFLYYDKLGELSGREYFLNDDQHGYSQYYNPGKELTFEYSYRTGWLTGIKQYDKDGSVLATNNFEAGNGAVICKHSNGKVSTSGTYRNYMLNGIFNYYFFDGSPLATTYYKNDMLDSIYKTYYHGGKLRSEGKYTYGEKVGKWKHYYADGKLKEEEFYKNGNLNIDKFYFNDGTIEREIFYKDGSLDGAYNIYGEKNHLAVRLNYKNGEIQSYQFEEKPGTMVSPIKLIGSTGKIDGKYPNTKPSILMSFVDNDLTGERLLYYTNGQVLSKGTRTNGYTHGASVKYFSDGSIMSEENYVMGDLHGVCKYFYPNGKVERIENYYLDERHGETIEYDESGKIKKSRLYHYGTLTSIK